MAYIQAIGHNVPLVLEVAKVGYAQLYAKVLHAYFEFRLSYSIFK
jgi:hypothetical protein